MSMPKDKCPVCGHMVDAVTCVFGNAVPSPGAVSVCVNCIGINVFATDLKLRRPTPQEYEAIKASKDWWKVQRAIAVLLKHKRNKP